MSAPVVNAHNTLLNHGFKLATDVDPRDIRNIRNLYVREVGWFRVRVILPQGMYGRPSLWLDLRAVARLEWSHGGDKWLPHRSQLARPTVTDVVDNALGFLSVVQAY